MGVCNASNNRRKNKDNIVKAKEQKNTKKMKK